MISKIGPFDILELVGRGAMGSVYRGLDPLIGRPVAIKVIRLIGYNDGEEAAFLKDRLFKEARAAGGLSHPGIVTIYQVGTHEDQAYIVMEYIDGPTLQKQLASEAPVNAALMSRVLLQTAAALDYAHQRGVVHRDIKPANIMLTAGGGIKVTDFGIAKTMLGHTATKTGVILGTPFYMSPEQIQGAPLSGRSDQFALAVVAFEMLTGRRPFQAEQVTSICYQIVHAEPPSPADINPELGAGVVEVLKKALAKNPEERFATCGEFAAALVQAYEQGLSQAKTRREAAAALPTPDRISPQPPPQIHRFTKTAWLAGIGFAVAVAALLAGALLLRSKPPVRVNPAPTTTASAAKPVPTPSAQESVLAPAPAAGARTPPAPVREAKLPAAAPVETPPPPSPAPIEAPQRSTPDGRVIWTGQATRGMLLSIQKDRASAGSLHGRLPGVPITAQIFPAENAAQGLTVFTSDERYATPAREDTPAGPATFSWDPRHETDLTVFEEPGPANNWEKLVVRVNSPKLTSFVVQWKKNAR